jgi:hypothetical protein
VQIMTDHYETATRYLAGPEPDGQLAIAHALLAITAEMRNQAKERERERERQEQETPTVRAAREMAWINDGARERQCPVCGAAPGQPCHSIGPYGGEREQFHKRRREPQGWAALSRALATEGDHDE